MKLINIDFYLDNLFGELGTRERKIHRKQAKAELKIELIHYARRGDKVTLKDIFSLK